EGDDDLEEGDNDQEEEEGAVELPREEGDEDVEGGTEEVEEEEEKMEDAHELQEENNNAVSPSRNTMNAAFKVKPEDKKDEVVEHVENFFTNGVGYNEIFRTAQDGIDGAIILFLKAVNKVKACEGKICEGAEGEEGGNGYGVGEAHGLADETSHVGSTVWAAKVGKAKTMAAGEGEGH
ncbi:hypothetical protein HK101_001843, partial [Irineochytrium annulatum]